MQNGVTEFSSRLQALFGEDLLAVILYGSAARNTYRKGVSDINILVILEKSSPRKIFEAGRAAKSCLRKYRIAPLIMTKTEFTSAADVFPLEYYDMQDAHTVVYGDAEILSLPLSRANLRYQLEEKLRGAVGDIRCMLITSGGNQKLLWKLLVQWSGVGGALFRGLLRLKGIADIPRDTEKLLECVSKEYEITLEGFSALHRFRQGEKADSLTLAESLLEPLKTLVQAVDAFGA
jgi:hypothetical protein